MVLKSILKNVSKKTSQNQLTIKELHKIETFRPNTSLKNKIEYFSLLPFTNYPFNKRNWGHNLHTLCSYQSRLKASIAYYLVQTFSKPGEKTLDPFSGVGTIPFEACLNGRSGYGSDINPVAYHTTLAKVKIPTRQAVLKIMKELEEFLLTEDSSGQKVDDYTIRFYHQDTLVEILTAKKFFLTNSKKHSKNSAFSFLLSCMLHILHGNRPYALSRRSHNLIPLAPRGPTIYKSVIKSLMHKIDLSFKNPLPERYVKGDAKISSVFELPFENEYFDSILTSPPFWGSTRFYANNRIRLWFCGWDYHTQEKHGRTVFLEELQRENLSVYESIFSEFYKVLKKNGVCVIHLGVTDKVDVGKEITRYAKNSGFRFIDLVYENTEEIERHGMKDQGVTTKHQYLILKKNGSSCD